MIKALLKRIPGGRRGYDVMVVARRYLDTKLKIWKLMRNQRRPFIGNPNSNVIVSITSFPARINDVWITVETLFQQNYTPRKIFLVLSEEEFPEKKLPKKLDAQIERGLEIIWVKKNTRSYKKLLPTRSLFPDAIIVTFDDDALYEPWRLRQLVDASQDHPDCVIGHRGREITLGQGGLLPYIDWRYAVPSTPSHRVLLTGAGGILYPPYILDSDLLLDIDKAMLYCPTADDIWFWAVCQKSSASAICLGKTSLCKVNKRSGSFSLDTINRLGGNNDIQLKNVIEGLDLWDSVAT